MADSVRYVLERMIPELEHFERKGYFSKVEIKKIVKKRTDFEYLLKRKAALKADFIRYIQYERKLEELRMHRKELKSIAGKQRAQDFAIVRRIHFIYERATRKFRGDLQLWLAWLEFCKQTSSNKQFSKVVTKALRLHPTIPGLWSFAAAWEFETLKNPGSARVLMQRGLRMCAHSQQLWVEYFRMELMYAAKLRARREVLGIATTGASDAQEGEVGDKTSEEDGAVEAVLSGAVAKIVFQQAIQAIPKDVHFRASFLAAVGAVRILGADDIRATIVDSIVQDFPEDEDAWKIRAELHVTADGKLDFKAANEVYVEATQKVPTPRMFELHLDMLELHRKEASGNEAGEAMEDDGSVDHMIIRLCCAAHESGAASEQVYSSWCSTLVDCGDESAVQRVVEWWTQAFPGSERAWEWRIEHAEQRTAAQDVGTSGRASSVCDLMCVVQQALMTCHFSAPLWVRSYGACEHLGLPLDTLNRCLMLRLAGTKQGDAQSPLGDAAWSAVDTTHRLQGMAAARDLYREILKYPPPSSSFFHRVIQLEMAAEDANVAARDARVRKLFESGVRAYGCVDCELWLNYAQFEQSHGKGGGDIFWRATKSLENADDFVVAYKAMMAS